MALERKISPATLTDIGKYLMDNEGNIGSFAVMAYAKDGATLPGFPGSEETDIPAILMFSAESAEKGADLFEQFVDIHVHGLPHIMAVVAARSAKRQMEQQLLLNADGKPFRKGN